MDTHIHIHISENFNYSKTNVSSSRLPRVWVERMDEDSQRVQIYNCRMNKFWGSYVQLDDYSQPYCIIYLKDTKRIPVFQNSHYKKKKKVTMS